MRDVECEFTLFREADRVFIRFADGGEPTPVKLLWARPISGRGGEVSIVGEDKEEVAMIENLEALDQDSRRVAEEALWAHYLLPRITRVICAEATFGVRYWHVETTLGERRFALKNADRNAVWLSDDHLVLKDTLGARYEINPFSQLDSRSQAEVEKVI